MRIIRVPGIRIIAVIRIIGGIRAVRFIGGVWAVRVLSYTYGY